MASTFWEARLEATEVEIRSVEGAITAFLETNAQVYILDTGQTRTRVERANLKELQDSLNSLYNRYETLFARCNLSGTRLVRPVW